MKNKIGKILFFVLFFSALWGLSEAVLGGLLYRFEVPYASVYLTVFGFSVLLMARRFLAGTGMLTLVAAFAMLYKFLNSPFFACHLLGILILGMSCDLFLNVLKLKNKTISAALAIYVNNALFAVMITYIFRYQHWVEAGMSKILSHVFFSGTAAALACALAVPLCQALGSRMQTHKSLFDFAKLSVRLPLTVATTGMWLFAVIIFATQYHGP